MESKRTGKPSKHVTDTRAAAQRAKLDAQAEERRPNQRNRKRRKTNDSYSQLTE